MRFFNARSTMASSAGGTSERRLPGRGGRSSVIDRMIARALSPPKGRLPVTSSYRTTPSDQTSARSSIAWPAMCSGAMYGAVPTVDPVRVTPVWSVSLAMPKSSSFTDPVSSVCRAVACASTCGLVLRPRRRSRAQEDVGRLDVAMNDAGIVRGGDRAGHLDHDVERFGHGQGAAGDALAERFAFVERHRQKQAAVRRLVDLVDGADVRMIERGSRLRLDDQPLLRVGVVAERRCQHLERHRPLQSRVFGLIDLAHAAGANERRNAVARQGIARIHEWNRRQDT